MDSDSTFKNEESISSKKVSIDELELDKSGIIKSLGYKTGNIDDHFVQMIDDVLNNLKSKCVLQAGYKLVNIKTTPADTKGFFLKNSFFNTDKIVASQLKKSEKAAIFVCSIGPGLENWAKQELKNGDPAFSFIIDTIASVITENLADYIHKQIAKDMSLKGQLVTNRYSPGYCNWSVSEQKKLFEILPDGFCGVNLTESSLMLPIKSVSGVIGIGAEVEWKDYICDKCGRWDCLYRAANSKLQ